MKWTDIVNAISSVTSNIIALAALVISLRKPLGTADDKRVPSTPTARNPPVPSYFMTHHEDKHTVRRMRHRMRLTSLSLAAPGKHGRPDCSASRRESGASPRSSGTGGTMTTEYLGIKQVSERLGVANAASYDLPEPDVTIGRTRGWLPDTIDQWNAQRPRTRRRRRQATQTQDRINTKTPLPQLKS